MSFYFNRLNEVKIATNLLENLIDRGHARATNIIKARFDTYSPMYQSFIQNHELLPSQSSDNQITQSSDDGKSEDADTTEDQNIREIFSSLSSSFSTPSNIHNKSPQAIKSFDQNVKLVGNS